MFLALFKKFVLLFFLNVFQAVKSYGYQNDDT